MAKYFFKNIYMERFQAGSNYYVLALGKGVQIKPYFADKGSRVTSVVVAVRQESKGF